jgi:hypothetical protein
MPEDIQKRMRALIVQHGSVLAVLATLRQQPEAQQNDEQTNSFENLVPHINAPAEFNQNTTESTRECRNRLQRERRAMQCTESAGPLQLFGDEDTLASARWDCGKTDTICGFCNAKMWIKERLAKSNNSNPQFSLCCKNGKVLLLSFPATPQELEVLLTNKERSAVKF